MNVDRELAAALAAANAAGDLIRREYAAFEVIPDAPVSISTHVDKASQELILNALQAAFPADAMCAEESTPALAAAVHAGSRVWVVDPIDGTRGFARKTGQFSVMIGLLVDGNPVVGVVLEPVQERLTYATAGGGCWVRVGGGPATACRVSGRMKLSESVLVQSWAKPGRPSKSAEVLKPGRVVETYSGGVKLAMVARGEADVYANTYARFHDWDICAGHVLVTEAGGTVTTLVGGAVGYGAAEFAQSGGLLATNGPLHQAVIDKLLAAA